MIARWSPAGPLPKVILAIVARVLPDRGWFVFSILQPCFPGWDADAPSAWPLDAGYHVEGWWPASDSGYRGTVGANHRMLSAYLDRLVGHGLAPTDVVQPPPDGAWSAWSPGRAPVRRLQSQSVPVGARHSRRDC